MTSDIRASPNKTKFLCFSSSLWKHFLFQIGKLLSIICFASGASSILKRLYSYGFDISDFFTRWRNTSLCLVIWGILVTSCFTIYTTSDKTTLFNFYIWLETTHYNLSNFHLIICISFSRMLPEKKAFVFFFLILGFLGSIPSYLIMIRLGWKLAILLTILLDFIAQRSL